MLTSRPRTAAHEFRALIERVPVVVVKNDHSPLPAAQSLEGLVPPNSLVAPVERPGGVVRYAYFASSTCAKP